MRTWMCLICGFVYDEAAGIPDEGIAPGTRWDDVPMFSEDPEGAYEAIRRHVEALAKELGG